MVQGVQWGWPRPMSIGVACQHGNVMKPEADLQEHVVVCCELEIPDEPNESCRRSEMQRLYNTICTTTPASRLIIKVSHCMRQKLARSTACLSLCLSARVAI